MYSIFKYKEVTHKYELLQSREFEGPVLGLEVDLDWVKISEDGKVNVLVGFCWDGASGPTYDSEYTQVPAWEHDVYYKLLRLDKIPPEYRKAIDVHFRKRLIECGLIYVKRETSGRFKWLKIRAKNTGVRVRARGWYKSVRGLAADAADKKSIPETQTLWYP